MTWFLIVLGMEKAFDGDGFYEQFDHLTRWQPIAPISTEIGESVLHFLTSFWSLFALKAKLYLFSSLQVFHLKWEYGEVSLPCYPIWPRLSDHKLEKILCRGLLEGVMDELQRKEAGSFRGDGTVVRSLGLGIDVFLVFFSFPLPDH